MERLLIALFDKHARLGTKMPQKAFFKHISFNREGDSNVQNRNRHCGSVACSMPVFAANDYPSAKMHTALPSEALTVTDWYKQNVYDLNENKIGDIKDVLVDKSGKVVAFIVGVGGFLGAGEKDVAVPFEAVHPTMKDKKWWLVMNTTKDNLKSAPGFRYDSSTTTWMPDRP